MNGRTEITGEKQTFELCKKKKKKKIVEEKKLNICSFLNLEVSGFSDSKGI